MSTKNKINHGAFWALLKKTDKYNEAYREDIKAAWVRQFSDGRTDSLSDFYEMHPFAYRRMIEALKRDGKQLIDRHDAQRKKLLYLIYRFCDHAGYECSKDVALKVACKACGVNKLNDASEQKVIAAIKAFEHRECLAWVSSVLDKVSEGVK